MGRLIDADVFKEMVGTDTKIRKLVCDLIDVQPTAYDLNDVAKQLTNLSSADADYTLAEDLVDRHQVLAIVMKGGAK